MPNSSASPSTSNSTPKQLLISALRRVLTAWLVGFAAVMSVTFLVDASLLIFASSISIASGLIAIASLCPVFWLANQSSHAVSQPCQTPEADQMTRQACDLVSAFVTGIVLRLFGTVALFLVCRYQLDQQPEMIAAFVGGWYFFLTSIEVISLAKISADLLCIRTNRQTWISG